MKQSNLQSTATAWIRSIEENGAAREREKYQKSVDRAISRIQGGVKMLLDLLEPPAEKPQPQPKKRKAVEASDTDIQLVREIFDAFEGPMIPKQIAKHTSIGIRRISRACIALSNQGVLDGGRGGYRLAQRKENGLDETVSAESSAR